MTRSEYTDQIFENVLLGTEQEHGISAARRTREQPLEEVNAGHAPREWIAENATCPHDRHAVGKDEIGARDRFAQQAVASHVNELRGIDDAQAKSLVTVDGGLAVRDDLVAGRRVNFDIEDLADGKTRRRGGRAFDSRGRAGPRALLLSQDSFSHA